MTFDQGLMFAARISMDSVPDPIIPKGMRYGVNLNFPSRPKKAESQAAGMIDEMLAAKNDTIKHLLWALSGMTAVASIATAMAVWGVFFQ